MLLTRTKHLVIGAVLVLALLAALMGLLGAFQQRGHLRGDFWPHAPTTSQAGQLLAAQGGPGVDPEDIVGPH